MSIRDVLQRLLGGPKQCTIYECRICGTTMRTDRDACSTCGSSEVASYDLC